MAQVQSDKVAALETTLQETQSQYTAFATGMAGLQR